MFGSSRGGVRGGQDQFNWEDVKTDKQRENYLGRWQGGNSLGAVGVGPSRTLPVLLHLQDFAEVCKREGGDPEEKGVDRLLGLGSASGSVGRVAMSREDKEAAKLGLSVFTHHRVESGGPGTSATSARRKPRAEDQMESSSESHRKSKKEKKKKKKKHKKEKKKKDKEHRQPAEAASFPTSPERPRHHHNSYSNSPCCKRRKRGHSGDRRSPSRRWHDRGSEA
uniref:Multiple myeloma tumor-associated protein 2-like N-terminal domain-containing protein n=1 Tax=Colobus angolensis palliatus TaxID=336983 RepID=A0A2K5IX96_COLAP